jgi:hypothetical protein
MDALLRLTPAIRETVLDLAFADPWPEVLPGKPVV